MIYKQALQNGLQKPIRNKAYLNYVGSLPCVICGQEPAGDAHHIIDVGFGGMGTKASDLFVFPLCRYHHGDLHDSPTKGWEELFGSQWEHVCMTLHQAVTDGVIDL